MKNLIAAIGLTLGLFAIVVYLAPWTEDAGDATIPEALKAEPDLYLRNARITQYQHNGLLQYELASEQILHFDDRVSTELTRPHLLLYNDPTHPWDIKAQTGRVELVPVKGRPENDSTEEVVYLSGDVVMDTTNLKSRVTLRSQAMTIYPDRQFVETDQSVTIDTDIGQTLAQGMQGDLQGGLLKLFSIPGSKVQTTVHPQNLR
jgi:lipopolysaccharide export system protein LptC